MKNINDLHSLISVLIVNSNSHAIIFVVLASVVLFILHK